MVGGVLSMLSEMLPVPTFPAISVAWPEIFWFCPSEATNCGVGHLATPDKLSVQLKVTVTLALFQPAPLGDGAAVAVTTGGVLSIFSVVVETAEVLPAWSVACAVKFCAAPSVETVTGAGQMAIPDR